MADVPEQPKAQPLLVTLMDQVDRCLTRLTVVTTNHRLLRGTSPSSELHAGMSLEIHIGGLSVPAPLPADPTAREALLQEAAASLGDEAVRLWRELHTVTTAAVQHLDGIAAKAQQG